jgi:hypothetical protein
VRRYHSWLMFSHNLFPSLSIERVPARPYSPSHSTDCTSVPLAQFPDPAQLQIFFLTLKIGQRTIEKRKY